MTDRISFAAPLTLKSGDSGEVAAIIATVGAVDRDKDVVRPGAIPDGARVVMSDYSHSAVTGGLLPVGHGELRADGKRLRFDGRLILDTERGRDTHAVLKALGTLAEWSFGFIIRREEPPTDAERRAGAVRALVRLEPLEVSPVLRGAGIGTGTLAVKRASIDAGLTREQRAELQAIEQRFRESVRQHDERARLAAIRAKLYDPSRFGRDASEEYGHVVAFAAESLGLHWRDRPSVYLVSPSALPAFAAGIYHAESKSIGIAEDLSRNEAERVVIHEIAHHWEALRGKGDAGEGFALQCERDLFEQWSHLRPARFPTLYRQLHHYNH